MSSSASCLSMEDIYDTTQRRNSADAQQVDHRLNQANLSNIFSAADAHLDIPDLPVEDISQTNWPILSSSESSSSNLATSYTDDNASNMAALSAQLDLLSSNDFNFSSMDYMSDFLSLNPMIFSNGNFPATEAVASGFGASVDPSASSLGVDNSSNMIFPMKLDDFVSSSSSVLVPSPTIKESEAIPIASQAFNRQVPPMASSESSSGAAAPETAASADRVAHSGSEYIPAEDAKLPIPRLSPRASNTVSMIDAGVRTIAGPSSSVCTDASPSPSSFSTNSRTKLSHCAVERRYRSNMKQYIKDLREAVPALRVLELKPGNRISNLSLKPGTRRVGINAEIGTEGVDVIDERGYIDGVKVAHNGSKTTAVLKSIEYIRVLKRREMRMAREQDGLKELICSFPGGPEALQLWEMTRREKYGGPEADEIHGEESDANRNKQSDGDASGGEDSSNLTGRKKVKRAKRDHSSAAEKKEAKRSTPITLGPRKYIPIMPTHSLSEPSLVSSVPDSKQPEKRKRGRPRKSPLPPLTTPNELVQQALIAQQQHHEHADTASASKTAKDISVQAQSKSWSRSRYEEAKSGQLLLAAFAFFSFFHLPSSFLPTPSDTSGSIPFTHIYSGTVLFGPQLDANTTSHLQSDTITAALTWRDAIQLVHLAFSVFLAFVVLRSRLFRLVQPTSYYVCAILSSINAVAGSLDASLEPLSSSSKRRGVSVRAFQETGQKLRRLSEGGFIFPLVEEKVYRERLGFRPGLIGLFLTLMRLIRLPERHDNWRMERRVYMRLVEIVALNARASRVDRLQILLAAFLFRYGCSYSATDVASLALLIHPVWRAKAAALWDFSVGCFGVGSNSSYIYKTYDMFVLQNMSVDDAAQRISRLDCNERARAVCPIRADAPTIPNAEGWNSREFASPLALLAKQAVHDHIRAQAERVFLQTVSKEEYGISAIGEAGTEGFDGDYLLSVGRSLNPHTVALVDLFDQVCNLEGTQDDTIAEIKDESEIPNNVQDASGVRRELQALLHAIILCRRIKMQPEVGRRNAELCLALKRCLDSAAFDRSDSLKSARSQVLEMLKDDD